MALAPQHSHDAKPHLILQNNTLVRKYTQSTLTCSWTTDSVYSITCPNSCQRSQMNAYLEKWKRWRDVILTHNAAKFVQQVADDITCAHKTHISDAAAVNATYYCGGRWALWHMHTTS